MKEYEIIITRGYTTRITLKFPDDGRNHEEKINECIEQGDENIWDLIAEKELEQMDVSNENWIIEELPNYEENEEDPSYDEIKENNTTTGALSRDTGPF